jgi:hypothetical protein
MRNLLKEASLTIGIGAMIMLSSVPQAQADEWNKKTIVTFSGPVEIPGKHLKGMSVLPAGTYVFRLVNSDSNRHIVQIFNERENKIYATILAIPNTRLTPADKTIITFAERPNGEPPALRAWFYPGDNWGDEFVYSKSKAKELAQTTKTPVLYNSSEETSPEVSGAIQAPAPSEVSEMNQSNVKAYNPAGEDMELSQAVTPPPPENMSTANSAAATTRNNTQPAPATSTASQLPQTASPLGWVMLSGLFALAGGLGVRLARQSIRS